MLNHAAIGLGLLDPQTGRWLHVNDELCAKTGYTSDELQLGCFWDITHPDDRDDGCRKFQALSRGELEKYQEQQRFIRKDGSTMPVKVTAVLMRCAAGAQSFAIVTVHDLTDRKAAEAALRRQTDLQDQWRNLSESVPGLIYTFRLTPDGHTSMPYVSAVFQETFGLKPGDVREDASAAFALIHPDDLQVVRDSIASSARQMKRWRHEFRVQHPEKGEAWLAGQSVPRLEGDGSILWHGFLHDITERKRSEALFRQLSHAVEQSPVSMVITDTAGRIEYINQRFTAISGYSLEELRGTTPRALKSGNMRPEVYQALWSTIQAGQRWHGELQNRTKCGKLIWEQVTISPLKDSEGRITHFVGLKEDISERKRLEAELRQAHKMDAIGRLAGGVAHDFNNVLTVILGYAEMLTLPGQTPEALGEAAKMIVQAADRAAGLTRQLLTFSRKQVLQPQSVDLNQAVTAFGNMLRRIIGEDVNLEFHLCDEPLNTMVDPGMLDQILLNLAVNARDAMPNGGKLTISTAARDLNEAEVRSMQAWQPGRHVSLAVKDTGCGIAPENLTRIFEPFFTTKERGKGTGLGLATVFGIVKQHGGGISVQSEVACGTTFEICLPSGGEKKPDSQRAIESASARGSETILLVEDDVSVRMLTRFLLESHGYRVLEASDGPGALQVWRERGAEIDLLYTDMVMPNGISGRDLSRRLRAERHRLKVVCTSGYSEDFAGRQLLLGEGEQFIAKPSSSKAILQCIRQALDRQVDAVAVREERTA